MPRIRSVHPGLFTDEAFLDATPLARLFLIGLFCEAYDDGVFEWKPRQLKVRLLPLDKADADGLLDELEKLGFLHRYRFKARDLGVIRNFQKWQSPQKPKSSNLLPPELIPYVSVGTAFPVRISDDYDTDTVTIPSGRERRGEEGKGDSAGAECVRGASAKASPDRIEKPEPQRPTIVRREPDPLEARWRGLVTGLPVLVDPNLAPIRELLEDPTIVEADIDAGIEAYVAKARRKPRCWSEFEPWIRRVAKDRIAAAPSYPGQPKEAAPVSAETDRIARASMALAHFRGEWRAGWPDSKRPGHPTCDTPAEIIAEAKRRAAIESGEMEAA